MSLGQSILINHLMCFSSYWYMSCNYYREWYSYIQYFMEVNFQIRTVYMWTISGFSAYNILFGWTYAFQLKHRLKRCWFYLSDEISMRRFVHLCSSGYGHSLYRSSNIWRTKMNRWRLLRTKMQRSIPKCNDLYHSTKY